MAYKPDQGRYARLASFWTLAILIFYGANSLHTFLSSKFPATAEPIGGVQIPIWGVDVSAAFLIAIAVCAVGIFFLYRWIETPKIADLLIETEAELRKVTWPTYKEVVNSSIVVVVCVLFLMAFLAGADFFFARIMQRVLFGVG